MSTNTKAKTMMATTMFLIETRIFSRFSLPATKRPGDLLSWDGPVIDVAVVTLFIYTLACKKIDINPQAI